MEFRVKYWDKYNDIHYGNWINCADRTIEQIEEGLKLFEKYDIEYRSVR